MTRKPIMEVVKAHYTDRSNEELFLKMNRNTKMAEDGYRIFDFGWHPHYLRHWGKVMANGDVLISLGRMNFETIGNVAK